MTKTLMIMRHAKSSWADASMADHDRPLNKRGLRDAPKVARFFAESGVVPDVIISSTANRARTTAELIVEHCPGIDCDVSWLADLYHAPASVYLEVLSSLTTDAETVMLVGHNPGMEQLVQVLSGEWHRMPTATTAVFKVSFDAWSDIDPQADGDGFELVDIWRPREIFK